MKQTLAAFLLVAMASPLINATPVWPEGWLYNPALFEGETGVTVGSLAPLLDSNLAALRWYLAQQKGPDDEALWRGLLHVAQNRDVEPHDRERHQRFLDRIENRIRSCAEGYDHMSLLERARRAVRSAIPATLHQLLNGQEARGMPPKSMTRMLEKLQSDAQQALVKYREIPDGNQGLRLEVFDMLEQRLRQVMLGRDTVASWQEQARTAVWNGHEYDALVNLMPHMPEEEDLEKLLLVAEQQRARYQDTAHDTRQNRSLMVKALRERLRWYDSACKDSTDFLKARLLVITGHPDVLREALSQGPGLSREEYAMLLSMAEDQLLEYEAIGLFDDRRWKDTARVIEADIKFKYRWDMF